MSPPQPATTAVMSVCAVWLCPPAPAVLVRLAVRVHTQQGLLTPIPPRTPRAVR